MFLPLLIAAFAYQPVDSNEQINFLRIAYKANRDAFAFGTFHFEYTKGRCSSLSDAESQVFSQAIEEVGLYIFDGKNERYDLLAEPAALAAVTTRTAKNKTSSFAMVFRMLTNSEVTLRDPFELDGSGQFFFRSPQIYPGTRTFCSSAFFNFPLSFGNCNNAIGDLYGDLTAITQGKGSITAIDFDSRLDGLAVCKLSYTFKFGSCTYWIDRNRGCLPIRVETHDDQSGSESSCQFGDFEQVAGAGWLPRRTLHIWANGRLADRVVVTKIDTRTRPGRSMFQLDFPQPVPLHDQAKGVVYPKRTTWSLIDLPGASSPGTRPIIQGVNTFSGEMPGEVEPGAHWLAVATAGVIILGIVASSVFLKRRYKRRQAA